VGGGASATPRAPAVGAGRGRAKDPAKDGRRRKSTLKEVETVDEDEQAQDQPTPMDIDAAAMPPPPVPSSASASITATTTSAQPTSTMEEDDDNDPLTRSNLPPLPTAQELQALLAAPPLSYSASRAAPSTSTAPPRRFCEMCGYWGRAKCMKCGARVCGIECRDAHEETRCLKFYA
jgi:zinc finger HIT domain-containing protein 1